MTANSPQSKSAGLLRRLGALIYDSLLLLGVLFLAAIPLTIMDTTTREIFWIENIIRIYLVGVCFFYFGWFWGHGGQTLGMRAWRLHLIELHGNTLTWVHFAKRFFSAWITLGLGVVTVMFSQQNRAIQDHLSSTTLIHRP